MIRIRQMTCDDIAFCMRLKTQAGWNQCEADWRRFIALGPQGCFVGELDGRPAATTTTSLFGSVGWISMVIVAEPLRGRGLGKAMVARALEYFDSLGVPSVRLDATALGKVVYERLGFAAEYELARYVGQARPGGAAGACEQLGPEHIDAALELDALASGADRRELLGSFFREHPGESRVICEGGKLLGFMTARPGSEMLQIGPAVASDPAAGAKLLAGAFTRYSGRSVVVDIPVCNTRAVSLAASCGLAQSRSLTRMCRGQAVTDHPENTWAGSGPEKG